MKRARIINAIIWIAIAAALVTLVVVQWKDQCEVKSIWLAAGFYTAACAAIGGVIDITIQGK